MAIASRASEGKFPNRSNVVSAVGLYRWRRGLGPWERKARSYTLLFVCIASCNPATHPPGRLGVARIARIVESFGIVGLETPSAAADASAPVFTHYHQSD